MAKKSKTTKSKSGKPDMKKRATMAFANHTLTEEDKDRIMENMMGLDPYPGGNEILYLEKEAFIIPRVLKRLHKKDRYHDFETLDPEKLDPLELVELPDGVLCLKHGYRRYRYMKREGITEFPCVIVGIAVCEPQVLMANLQDMSQFSKPMTNWERTQRLLKTSRHIHRVFGDRVCGHGGKRKGKKDWVSETALIYEQTGLGEDTVGELLRFGKRIGLLAVEGLAEYYPEGMGTKKTRRFSVKHKHLGKEIDQELKRLEEKRGCPLARKEKVKHAGLIAYNAFNADSEPSSGGKGKGGAPPPPPSNDTDGEPARDMNVPMEVCVYIAAAAEELRGNLAEGAVTDEGICERYERLDETVRLLGHILQELGIRQNRNGGNDE
ncbi:hypothetical protein SAMN02745216_02539 [Desulfatibacillum alkenivorans DSM 16219]|jgi:hypothetical protein|uniref:Uncharacterized protein n=1 Tax=Desulfatibacillum alkenivorans DSM 16219 TaxID=1121393 RepID=A0A1M6N772_9BACT|nr:hypothetical protein [Desulfatibacillum alkenivorans]SHJ91568.1 hypothetical protein SAMN02745216_02539 [Desulfatibacillum alkenivorans DSM 16219]